MFNLNPINLWLKPGVSKSGPSKPFQPAAKIFMSIMNK